MGKVVNLFLILLDVWFMVGDYFLQPDNILYGREGAEMVKIASIS